MTYAPRPPLDAVRRRFQPPQGGDPSAVPTPLYAQTAPSAKLREYPFALASEVAERLEAGRLLAATAYRERPGRSGQVICIESLMQPELRSGCAELPCPVYVLLDREAFVETEEEGQLHLLQVQVWHGWLVTPDVEYVSEFDVLLNDDELREEPCRVAQAWNRIQVFLPTSHRVAGHVGDGLLAAVRHLSRQFQSGADAVGVAQAGAPGHQLLRTVEGAIVATGTHLDEFDPADPRNEYVHLYAQFAGFVSQAVWHMLADARAERQPATKPSFDAVSWIERRVRLLVSTVLPQGGRAMARASSASRLKQAPKAPAFRITWAQDGVEWILDGHEARVDDPQDRIVLHYKGELRPRPTALYWQLAQGAAPERFALTALDERQFVVQIRYTTARDMFLSIHGAQDPAVQAALLPAVHS